MIEEEVVRLRSYLAAQSMRRTPAQIIEELLLILEDVYNHLTASVLQADPFVHLDITWKHFELGEMHWREWLLFARVHLLDHIRQVNQIHILAE